MKSDDELISREELLERLDELNRAKRDELQRASVETDKDALNALMFKCKAIESRKTVVIAKISEIKRLAREKQDAAAVEEIKSVSPSECLFAIYFREAAKIVLAPGVFAKLNLMAKDRIEGK